MAWIEDRMEDSRTPQKALNTYKDNFRKEKEGPEKMDRQY